jgi:hypothetical protein
VREEGKEGGWNQSTLTRVHLSGGPDSRPCKSEDALPNLNRGIVQEREKKMSGTTTLGSPMGWTCPYTRSPKMAISRQPYQLDPPPTHA